MPAPGETKKKAAGLADNVAGGFTLDLAQQEVVLRVLNTDMTGWVLQVPEGQSLLGREPDCRLHLPHHTISRRHCSIRLMSDLIEVIDLNSMNGTMLNGALIREATLRPGDRIRVGEVDLALEVRLRSPAPDHPASGSSSPADLPPNLASFHIPTASWAVRAHAETVRYQEVKRTMRFDPDKRDAFRQFRDD